MRYVTSSARVVRLSAVLALLLAALLAAAAPAAARPDPAFAAPHATIVDAPLAVLPIEVSAGRKDAADARRPVEVASVSCFSDWFHGDRCTYWYQYFSISIPPVIRYGEDAVLSIRPVGDNAVFDAGDGVLYVDDQQVLAFHATAAAPATWSTKWVKAGYHSFGITGAPDPSAAGYFYITPAATEIGLTTTSLAGDGRVTLWAALSVVAPGRGAPTGTVSFTDETGQVLATVQPDGGVASATVTLTTGRPHVVTATYSGDDNFSLSRKSVVIPVVALTANASALTTTDGLTLTATVAGPVSPTSARPSGSISFADGATGLGIATLSSFGQTSPFALGGSATCALVAGPTRTGGVACLGDNGSGQLGNGSGVDALAPVGVSGLATDVASVAAGSNHACAVTVAGAVRCWGANASGQLGDATTVSKPTPVEVSGLASGAVMVAAGHDHACALLADGSVRCWGANDAGQLGDGTTNASSTPVTVTGLAGRVISIAAGGSHSCALIRGGTVQCWGRNDMAQLGNGTPSPSVAVPVAVAGLGGQAVQLALGARHSCALLYEATVQCWGDDARGQVGDGVGGVRARPAAVPGPVSVVEIVAGDEHTCAINSTGAMACWGANDHGQIGDGTTVDRAVPVAVTAIPDSVGAIGAGGGATCAVGLGSTGTAGRIWCWGDGGHGRAGNGADTPALTAAFGFDPATPAGFSGWLQSRAAVAIPPTGVGVHGFTAFYTGDATTTGSTSAAVDVTVVRTPVALALSASTATPTHGDALTLTATVSAAEATGEVTFYADGGSLGTGTVTAGVARLTTTALGAGARVLTAAYSGDTIYAGATSGAVGVDVAREAASVVLAASGDTIADEQAFLRATVTPAAATGTVTFTLDGGVLVSVPVTNGTATVTTPGLSAGPHTFVATYSGDGDRLGATSAPLTRTMAKRESGVVFDISPTSSSAGETITVNAYVRWTGAPPRLPIGSVVISLDGVATVNAPLIQQRAVAVFSKANAEAQLAPGSHTISASYSGDASFLPTSASVSRVITKIATTTTLAASTTDLLVGHPEVLTLTVTPPEATGAIDVFDGGSKIATVTPTAGSATLTLPALSLGTHVLTATYAGDDTHATSDAAAVTVTVSKSASATLFSTTRASGAYGDPATLAARVVSGNPPTGSVAFTVGGTTVATAALGPIGGEAGTVTAFEGATCALATTGVSCWGSTAYGKLGIDPTTASRSAPVTIAGLQTPVAVVGGGDHVCAIAGSRRGLQCWGANSMGQLGGGTTSDFETTPVTAITSGVTAMAMGANHGCALNAWGAVSCWGFNAKGQLGNGSTTDAAAPVVVSGLPSGATAITAGAQHSCALMRDGAVWCWGAGAALGTGSATDRATPVAVTGLSGPAVAIAAGATGGHTCALLADTTVECWGANRYGQLGNGTTTNGTVPVAVSGLTGVARIAAGAAHTCAAASNDTVTCWGSGAQGRLGTGALTDATRPVAVAAAFGSIAALSAAGDHTCVETSDGAIACWGADGGVAGTATTDPQTTPAAVAAAPSALVAARAVATTRALPLGSTGVVAAWAGDAASLASADAAKTILIGTATPTIALSASPASASFGTPVTVTATLSSPLATGEVVFSEAGGTLATVAIVDGAASFTLPAPSVGTHALRADYAGDTNFDPAPTASLDLVVDRRTSTTAVSGPTTLTVGTAATFSATVTPSTATGRVTFFDAGRSIGSATLANGTASVTVSGLAVGGHAVTASYAGDTHTAPSTSAAMSTQVAGRTSSLVLSGPSSAVSGQTVTFTATIAPAAATGRITFRDGATVLGTASLAAGRATLSTAALAVGTHAITAAYAGDASYAASTATAVSIRVAPAATTVTLSANKTALLPGAPVTLTATVAVVAPGKGTPAGAVTFRDGAKVIGTAALTGGVATLSTVPAPSGVHGLTASFAGSATLAAASGATSVEVDPRLGAPVQVNTTKAGSQQHAAIATLADGSSVVVWQSAGQDGSDLGVYGQRRSAAGARLGTEFRVATTTAGAQSQPAVAALKGGGFVVVWQSAGQDGSGLGVYLKRYAANGTAQGTETIAATTTKGDQQAPAVAALADGGFVVAWQSAPTATSPSTIRARRWSAAGVPAGPDFRADTTTTTGQTAPTVAGLEAGGFLIAWVSTGSGGSTTIRGQAFTAAAAKAGGEVAISTSTVGGRSQPVLAPIAGGGAVAVWTTSGQTGATRSLFLQRLGPAATRVGGETRVVSQVAGDQTEPSVAGFPAGGFVVAWTAKSGTVTAVRQRRFRGDGTAADVDLPMELAAAKAFGQPAVTVTSGTAFSVVFTAAAPVGAAEEIEVQRHGLAVAAP